MIRWTKDDRFTTFMAQDWHSAVCKVFRIQLEEALEECEVLETQITPEVNLGFSRSKGRVWVPCNMYGRGATMQSHRCPSLG